jgi:hypothetical protein
MNYRVVIDEKFQEFRSRIPEYTFAQTVLAALKQLDNFKDFQKSDLLDISDEDFYTAVENAYRKENDKLIRYKD